MFFSDRKLMPLSNYCRYSIFKDMLRREKARLHIRKGQALVAEETQNETASPVDMTMILGCKTWLVEALMGPGFIP